jgi:hypothetical protein
MAEPEKELALPEAENADLRKQLAAALAQAPGFRVPFTRIGLGTFGGGTSAEKRSQATATR